MGTSILAPATAPTGGYNQNPEEYLTVNWSVTFSGGFYDYSYVVNNPLGDVLLNNDGSLTTTTEIVDAFQVGFNAAIPGAVVTGPGGGLFQENNGANGLFWLLAPVPAGGSSPALTFQSVLPPVFANANAQDSDPPSPWSSTSPSGQTVPVPGLVPEPSTIGLFAMAGSMLLPWRSVLRRKAASKQ